jgi:hypothetical protein
MKHAASGITVKTQLLTPSPAARRLFCLGGHKEVLKVWHASKTYKPRELGGTERWAN